ncbi:MULTISPECIES: DUF1266 domain-containing protein [unclassified Modicisalibacter]|uniref:DUF1266 domain-containing protein n=1 Tax=unclassified Modicisalibacter TaxID=2679913 RepID=UPI001CCE4048|nr:MULTISPECIES: DUF1266 domain-containing protein [unclassified Modicisalibacter]MBZ9560068.1 DUF1266 domain-containing protein [Modicisalibacter sp. R2A 31.J]MBZ9575977.1 DUF1266 domain-containing protein [Modicisalibacter sp. MOD 31.J]
MVDPLYAWWAQQLVLCGWAFEPDPTSLELALAIERLSQLGVPDRGELGWRLIEGFPPGGNDPRAQLAALEMLALGAAAGWLPEERVDAWLHALCRGIHSHHDSLDAWLSSLRRARLAAGWHHGDEAFAAAGEALSKIEADGDGVTWPLLADALERRPRGTPWPEAPGAWPLRAAFAPVLVLPPAQRPDWPDAEAWLAEGWQVHGRDELIRVMLWLAGQGHRYGWDIDAARLVEMDAAARQAWLAGLGEQRRYGKVLLRFLERGEPLEWAAWDWLRLADLAYAGAALGWLEPDEAEQFAGHAADLVMRRYSDWTALTLAYQRGRSLFEGRDEMAAHADDWALLLHSPLSPWHAPLAELLDEPRREASRQAMRAWRHDTRHWLLALASVREPDLLYRQGIPVAVDDARRRDVRRYLQETLALFPDEGVGGLARFWLPAQVHHLNQLAADAAHNALPSLETRLGRPPAEAVGLRDALKPCVRHAATIFMAEKYAFYLLMADDSGDFEATGLQRLAESLRGVLCRFYPDPRRLLDAWASWEAALPELPDDSLVHEIRWHRDDPGSPFHWLDWRQTAWQEPGPRPTLSRFTALALAGPLNAGVWAEPQPEGHVEREAVRQWLDSQYGLHSAAELDDFLSFLLEAGDRQEYQINYAPYTLNASRLEEEIAILESGECDEDSRNHLLRLKRVRDNDAGCNEADMTAWDIAQAVDIAVAGRSLDWLGRDAFGGILDAALGIAQRHYGNWRDYALGLYAGFSFFMGETDEREALLDNFRQALVAWLSGAPPLAGCWASLDFPGARPRHWAPMHIDTLPGDARTLH